MLRENIQIICKEKGIAIAQLERDLNFPRGYIFKWNDIDPGASKVKKVADYLHIKVDKLLKESEGKE